jgi:hypothetical protein
MVSKVITPQAHTNAADRFVQAIDSANNLFYVFMSNHLPASDEQNVEPIVDSDHLYVDTYDNMLFGKQITSTDINLMTKKIVWESGTIYDAYNDETPHSDDLQFYVAAQDGTNYNVYKCLYSPGTPSTVSPTGTDLDPVESPVDGYIWKYMYTIIESDWAKFATTSYMPVFVNEDVKAAAVPQAINVIRVVDTGAGYSNYLTGAFRLSDLRIGNDTTYAIADDASAVDDFYQGCIIKMITGPAAGQYRTIVNYGIVNSKKQITLDSSFSSPPEATDEYEIYPAVEVKSTFGGATVAKARAIISSSGNTVSSVEVLENGKYHRSVSASVYYHPSVNVSREAELDPVVSPTFGHGGDVATELGARFACVSVSFLPTDTVLPNTNSFRQIGVIKNPTFNNVKAFIDQQQTAAFISDEKVIQYTPVATLGDIAITGNTITGTSTVFDNELSIGDMVLVANNTHSDVVTVSDVTSNTVAQAANSVISNISGTGYRINVTAEGRTGDVSTGALQLNKVTNKIIEGGNLFGYTSKGTATVKTSNSTFNAVELNNRTSNNFNTFIQLTTFTGSIVTGTFVEDEQVAQSPTGGVTPTAYVHSVDTNNQVMYVSNIENTFAANDAVLGQTSQAQFTLADKYEGDLTVDSGEIIYLENVLTVNRVSNKSETVKLILEF